MSCRRLITSKISIAYMTEKIFFLLNTLKLIQKLHIPVSQAKFPSKNIEKPFFLFTILNILHFQIFSSHPESKLFISILLYANQSGVVDPGTNIIW